MEQVKVYLHDGTELTYKGELGEAVYVNEQEEPISRKECVICRATGMSVLGEDRTLRPIFSNDVLELWVERRNAATHTYTNVNHGKEKLNMVVYYSKNAAAYRVAPANSDELEEIKKPVGSERYPQEVYYKPFLSAHGVHGIIHGKYVGNRIQNPELFKARGY